MMHPELHGTKSDKLLLSLLLMQASNPSQSLRPSTKPWELHAGVSVRPMLVDNQGFKGVVEKEASMH